ncbi:MAG: hypothetical protein H8E44_22890 [Planctomycetes bacterium]|nr:hypothetical protein [Planctomycetota bacterium]
MSRTGPRGTMRHNPIVGRIEMPAPGARQPALETHNAGDARVIPIMLRTVDWKGAPFSQLQA